VLLYFLMVKANLQKVRSAIDDACRRSGRKTEEVTLVAVTKVIPLEMVQQAIDAGVQHVAENRVQEAESKFPALLAKNPGLTTHIIGHLQTNKAKDALKVCSLIQSVDSLKLAAEIDKQAGKTGTPADILVQFNTAREEQKFGAAPEEAYALMEGISRLANVRIKGLMTMAPYTEDQGIVRKTFADLRGIRDGVRERFKGNANVQMSILSMGMSGDFKIAIEEGSTMVRVGSAIFKND
jgi:pyridoxal phosphate enzyme (YggS family)